MANIQHLYRGEGNPNDNPALELTGDAVGNHLYQDSNDSMSVWISTYEGEGNVYHGNWFRLVLESSTPYVEAGEPQIEGQMGVSYTDETLFIAMRDPDSGYTLRWRSTGTTLGDWYTPQTQS